jgi:lysophospholipase L1-like esterase
VRRHLLSLAASAVGAALVLAPVPAQAAGSAYVALGDSYSSGTGTRTYLSDGTSCQRSIYAYPALIASSKGYALNHRACSGATTANVTNLQLGSLGLGTAYVSLTVGGNDAGFADVLTECAQPAWASNCGAEIDKAVTFINGTLPGRLSTLYQRIDGRAPQAKVVVGAYPRVFNGEDCNAGTWFSSTEMSRLNSTADLLNQKIAAAASAVGFGFAEADSFRGHAVCDDVEWLNGLSNPVPESYHPNRPGHSSGYAPAFGRQLTGSTVTVTAMTMQVAEASAEEQAARQRGHAAKDRAIEPELFVAPDLSSPAMRAAARRAGVDLDSQASIDAADRAYEARQQAARHR